MAKKTKKRTQPRREESRACFPSTPHEVPCQDQTPQACWIPPFPYDGWPIAAGPLPADKAMNLLWSLLPPTFRLLSTIAAGAKQADELGLEDLADSLMIVLAQLYEGVKVCDRWAAAHFPQAP